MSRISDRLDALPRAWIGRGAREAPTFRTCGIVGFYLALVTLLAGGLLTGRSLLVLAVLAVVCAASFFVWAVLRRRVTGSEDLVVLEHVWFAEACAAAVLVALREPVLPYLDVVAVALAIFLAAGRVGCVLVGCCHGKPSGFGIRYGEELVEDGFPRHLAGVRLFPVPAVEALGLTVIWLTGLAALPASSPGTVLAWFLGAYAIMRFGLEGLRGDPRPHFLGLSQSRWMCLVELGGALVLSARAMPLGWARGAAILLVLALTLGVGLVIVRRRDSCRLLAQAHVAEVARLVAEGSTHARVGVTSLGVTVASGGSSVSLAPQRGADLETLCELAVQALPRLDPERTLLVDGTLHASAGPGGPVVPAELYGILVRRLQAAPPEAEPVRAAYFASSRNGT